MNMDTTHGQLSNLVGGVVVKQKAWVVFSGQTDLPWLRLLKPGFRHCYVIINDGENWISVDPLSCHTEVLVHHLSPDFNLPAWLEKRNLTVVPATITPQQTLAPMMVHSCVEAVKRVLGLHDFWVFTPYQLYKRLMARQNIRASYDMASGLLAAGC